MMKRRRVLAASKEAALAAPVRAEASRERRLIDALPAVLAVSTLVAGSAAAQEKCKISWESEASDAKYTQQLALDVGDIPGHQVRVYELHRIYPNAKPNCEGLKWTEQWSRSYSDLIERSGRTWGYTVTILENGDKIFAEFNGTVQTRAGEDGSKRTTYEGTAVWTGGTGKYQAVRGVEWQHVAVDANFKGQNKLMGDAEYWFVK